VNFLRSLNSKILLLEIRLRYIFKTLPFLWKIIFLALLIPFLVSGLVILHKTDSKLSTRVPAQGGVLREGLIGTPRFVNPILAITDADRDLVSLVYSGLMRFGPNGLILDLAKEYETSEDGLCYTFTLKNNLLWSDNMPLTSDDVIFTIKQIKNPTIQSPKRAGWEGVKPEKINEKTIKFCLETPYAPFLENTTIGIIPSHIWKNVPPEQMTLSNFNLEALGSGPYKIKNINRNSSGIIESYSLIPNKNFALKKPFLEKIVLRFYPSEQKLAEAYENNKIDGLSGISPQHLLEIKKDKSYLKTYQLPRVFAVFLNQDNTPIFTKKEVRQALNLGVEKEKIVKDVLHNFGVTIETPIPPGSLGFLDLPHLEKTEEERINEARELLEKNGWDYSEDEKVFKKETKKENLILEFSLSTSNMPDLVHTAELLKTMWEKIGIKVNVNIFEISDLEQNVIRSRKYDALLFGEVMGKDPDAFAFWHSSQRNDPGLNIALYANITVDKLLEEARTTFDIKKRKEKYEKFQEEVIEDSPAVFLYSPYFIHLLPQELKGITQNSISISSERFSQIYKWYLKTKKIWKIFLN